MSSSLYRRLHGLFTKSAAAKSQPRTSKPTATATVKPSSPVSPEEQTLQDVVKKFKKASNSDRFRARYNHYEATVRRLGEAKRFSYVEDILEHQKNYRNITNENFTVRLISLYGKAGMFDHAYRLFEEMPQLNCERSVMSFNALLAACVNSKKFDKIGEFFRELPEKLSIEPDIISYNTVIKAFCEMDSFDSALSMIDEMEKNGFRPDSITFNTLLNGFYRKDRFSDAENFWLMMESKDVVPNVRSYNAKLRALADHKRMLDAVELFDEMRRKEVKPDVFSFNALIKGFVHDGNLEESKKWYSEITKSDCVPDKVTFRMLIPLACEKGDFDFARELSMKSISRRCIIAAKAMQQVVDGLAKESKIEEAKELVALGMSNNHFHYELKLPMLMDE